MSRDVLIAWADAQRGKPFKWGETDCATIARWACQRMHGTDPFSLPTWRSKAKALRVFRECGGIAKVLGQVASPVGRGFARTGDIALLKDKAVLGNSLMVVIDTKVLVSRPETGVTLEDRSILPISTSFWRVA
jgi:hypothetical protein